MICALEMEPNSLSIGDVFLSNINRKKKSIAQCAKVKEHQIQIENWDQKSR
jgi:hypothetical protein